MHREGHYGATLLLAAPLMLFLNLDVAIIGTGLMMFVTPLPDKDHRLQKWAENSTLVKVLPSSLSSRIRSAFRHRGIMHTFLFAFVVGVLAGTALAFPLHVVHPEAIDVGVFDQVMATPIEIGVFVAAMVSYAWIGHIYADTLTTGSGRFGVKPYWPFSRKQVRFGFFKAANKWANGGLLLLGLLAFSSAFYYKVFYVGALSTLV